MQISSEGISDLKMVGEEATRANERQGTYLKDVTLGPYSLLINQIAALRPTYWLARAFSER
jgi:hypothetical protein